MEDTEPRDGGAALVVYGSARSQATPATERLELALAG